MSHINLSDIKNENINIGKSGRSVKLLYSKQPFQIVTCKLYLPFGLKETPNNYSQLPSLSLDCSIDNSCIDNQIYFENLDEYLSNFLAENKHYLDINMNNDELKKNYFPILKENKSYPKLLKINLPRDNNGNLDFVLFDSNKERITINNSNITEILTKGKTFKAIIECSRVWFFQNKIGTTWILKQLRFCDKKIDPIDNNIINDSILLDD